MKVLLVIPPSPYMTKDNSFPPLGILYIAAVLEKNNYSVKICDLTGEKKYIDRYSEFLKKYKPDAVGFTATTSDIPIVVKLFKKTRKLSKNITTIIGGSHATILPDSLSMFDRVGDGFEAIIEAFNSEKKYISQKKFTDITNLFLPSRHLINLKKYKYLINGKRAINIISHLGCPYNCIFCCGRNIRYYKIVRFRNPENVVEEMDFLNKKYGYEAFMFYDDEFNVNKKYSLELLSLLAKRKYIWRAPMRANLLDEELVREMKKAGCVEVTVGVESGSDKVLKLINKQTTVEINTKAYKLIKKYGIRFKAFIIVGLPGSKMEDELLTERWLTENPPDDIDVTPNLPYPSTPEYENPEKYGIKFKYNFFRDYVSFKFDPLKIKVYADNSHLTRRQILYITKRLLKKFKKKL